MKEVSRNVDFLFYYTYNLIHTECSWEQRRNTMNIEQLRSTITSTHSRMFVVRFTKQDGSERVMYAKTGIKRYISKKPNKRKVSNTNPNLSCVS